jgi:hypothetical protein
MLKGRGTNVSSMEVGPAGIALGGGGAMEADASLSAAIWFTGVSFSMLRVQTWSDSGKGIENKRAQGEVCG